MNMLHEIVYKKLAEEQEKYENWLLTLPAKEILTHAYEYSVRNDILMSMENEWDLDAHQLTALLESPDAMSDLYKAFAKLETDYMETIRDVIEKRSEELSHRRYCNCRAEIENAINANYLDNTFDAEAAVSAVLDKFSLDCASYVTATCLLTLSHDGRISEYNRKWANGYREKAKIGDYDCHYFLHAHPGLIDLFTTKLIEKMM